MKQAPFLFLSALALLSSLDSICQEGGAANTVFVAEGDIRLNASEWERGCHSFTAGGWHSLAQSPNGEIIAWGNNALGQTTPPANLTGVSKLVAGFGHSSALLQDGSVVNWGDPLGDPPADLESASDLAAGFQFSCAVTGPENGVTCWGNNDAGQLYVPADLAGAASVHCGGSFAYVILEDRSIVGWGSNLNGQLNLPSTLPPYIHKLSLGHNHVLALGYNGQLWAWGRNLNLELAIPQNMGVVRSIAAGLGYSAALSDDTLQVWGRWNWAKPEYTALQCKEIQDIHGGAEHLVVEFKDGTFEAWGSSEFAGNLDYAECLEIAEVYPGLSHHTLRSKSGEFVSVGSRESNQHIISSTVTGKIAGGESFSIGVRSNGRVAIWGNASGYFMTPSESGFVEVDAGHFHAVAIRENGDLFSMGFNQYGQIQDLPTSALSASVAPNATAVVLTDGSLHTAGSYGWGDLPTDLPDLLAVDVCDDHIVALSAPGEMLAWGDDCGAACNNLPEGPFASVHAMNGLSAGLRADSTIAWSGDATFSGLNNWSKVHKLRAANLQMMGVIEHNFPPYALVNALPPRIICEGASDSLSIDGLFTDRENDELTYSLLNHNAPWVNIFLNENNQIIFDGSSPGIGNLTLEIVATDSGGLWTSLGLVLEEKSNPTWHPPQFSLVSDRNPDAQANFPIQHHSPLTATIGGEVVHGPLIVPSITGLYDWKTPKLISGSYIVSDLVDIHGCRADGEYLVKLPSVR